MNTPSGSDQDAVEDSGTLHLRDKIVELEQQLATSQDELREAKEEQSQLRTQFERSSSKSVGASDSEKVAEDLRAQLKDVEAVAERATAAKAVAELRLQLGAVNQRNEDQNRLAKMEDQLKQAEEASKSAVKEEEHALKKALQAQQRGEEKVLALGQLSAQFANAQQENALLQARLDQLELRAEERLEQQEVRAKEREELITEQLLQDSVTQTSQVFKSELASQETRNDELKFELNEARKLMSAAPWERDMEDQRIELNRVKDELRLALSRIAEYEGQDSRSRASWDLGGYSDKADQAAGAPYQPSGTMIRKARAKVSLRNAAHAGAQRLREAASYVFSDPRPQSRGDDGYHDARMERNRPARHPSEEHFSHDVDSPSHVQRVLEEEVDWRTPAPHSTSAAARHESPANRNHQRTGGGFLSHNMQQNRAAAASRAPAQPLNRQQRIAPQLTRTRGSAILNFERRLAAQEALGLNGNTFQRHQGHQGYQGDFRVQGGNDRGRQERRVDPRPYRGGWRRNRDD